jgi:hypothetical protein
MCRNLYSFAFRASLLALISLMFGCASLRNGGVPESLPTVQADRHAVDEALNDAGAIGSLLRSGATETQRNSFIQSRLLALDLRYYEFVTRLRYERQAADAALQLTQIGLGVAGVATSAPRTKTNLAATAAALVGVKAVVDKEYYFDKTVPALVAMMNAKRSAVLAKIKESMGRLIAQYGASEVLADLDKYERSGQLAEAVAAVEVLAKAEEEASEIQIRGLQPVTEQDADEKRALNARIAALKPANEANSEKLKKALIALGGTVVSGQTHDQLFAAVWTAFGKSNKTQIAAAKQILDNL